MASRDPVRAGKFTDPDNIETQDESSVSTKPTVYDTDTSRTLEYVPYKDVKKLLEDAITEEEEMEDVKLGESFLRDFDYNIDRKDRDSTTELKLLSERNTRYENFGKKEMHYTFTSSHEDSQSLALMTESGSSIRIGGNADAKFMSGGVGGDVGYEHSSKKGKTTGEGHAEKKDLTINGVVDPGE